MLFPFHCQAEERCNTKMHKLTSIDNCVRKYCCKPKLLKLAAATFNMAAAVRIPADSNLTLLLTSSESRAGKSQT